MRDILKKYWGYDDFRPMQAEIIQSVLDGHDTLALLPTGGGKSICFQVPALAKEGICIVISPLIALMKDQVYNLRKRNINAVAIYSGMHYHEIDRIFDNCVYGDVKFLYLSPERLMTELARERIKNMNVNLIAVDEAHCISQWGYDFRPPYLQIAELRNLKPKVPVLALTATATPEVIQDIQEKLAFKHQNPLQKSFARNNLAYIVLHEEGKHYKMLEILRKIGGSGVVYVRNRRSTKNIATYLREKGISADFYHAGLSNDIRSKKQEAWINDKIRIMVATNAFGMGIDKPDVRIVIHVELPDTLEAYFQEAGRAGRDGKKSYAVLLYNDADKANLEKQYKNAFPEWKEVQKVYRALGSFYQLAVGSGAGESFDFDILKFVEHFKLEMLKTYNCLKILAAEGWIVLTEAVFSPSTIHVKVTKDELYDYEIRNRQFDLLLKTILRTYQGAFNHAVPINEHQLSRFLKTSLSRLQQSFLKLHSDQIIDYKPPKDKPQIIFIQERVDANNLTYDKKAFEFRKDRHLRNIKAAIKYATVQKCRSQMLLAYFGEKETPACGQCDFCLGSNVANVTKKEFKRLENQIRQRLRKSPLSLSSLVRQFPSNTHNKIIKIVEYLLDNEIIKKKEDKLYWNK